MKVTQVIAFNSKKSGLYDYANLYASNSKDILVLSECDESSFRVVLLYCTGSVY